MRAAYKGDGDTAIAVFSIGRVRYGKNSVTDIPLAYRRIIFSVPVDGDGRADIAVFRPSNGVWYITNSTNGSFTITQFGTNGDRPTQSAFVN